MMRITILVWALLLTGCTDPRYNPFMPYDPLAYQPKNVLFVTVVTDPPGAVIYSGANRMGYSPIRLQYTLSSENIRLGEAVTPPTRAVWISGASTIDENRHYKLANGLNWNLNLKRPDNVAGRDKDEQFGFQVQAQKNQEEQQGVQNVIMMNQSMQNSAYRPAPRINCTSTSYIPGVVNTNCQ